MTCFTRSVIQLYLGNSFYNHRLGMCYLYIKGWIYKVRPYRRIVQTEVLAPKREMI